VELKIQRLVDINRGEEDDHLFNERQSRETVRQLRKSRKLRQLEKIRLVGYRPTENFISTQFGYFEKQPKTFRITRGRWRL
jgi:hypothetical protein